jgi:hypothetical protein
MTMKPLRLLVMAAALNGTLGMTAATAQTLFLRNAPAGTAVEVLVNGTQTGQGTVGEDGNASVPFTIGPGKTEMDANVYVDLCDKVRRVTIMDRGKLPAPPAGGCERREIAGVFWVRPLNTVVVNLGGVNPSLLLVKGKYTPQKETAEGEEESSGPRRQAPTGFVILGGAGFTKFRDATRITCGNVPNCTDSSGVGYEFGADYWFTRFVAAEVKYLSPKTLTMTGSDADSVTGAPATFNFTSTLNTNHTTVAGLLAAPLGPVRLFGKGGMNYHQGEARTTETIDQGTQTFTRNTRGWSWLFGGGGEVWFTSNFGIYGEVGRLWVKGNAEVGQSGSIDDRLNYLMFGARFHIGKAKAVGGQ